MKKMRTKDEISSVIRKIKSLNLNADDSYVKIIEIIENEFEALAFPSVILNPKIPIFRSRENQDGNDFNFVNEISYRKDLKSIKDYGRANLPGQAIFYAGEIRATAAGESSKIFREFSLSGIEKVEITTGRWISNDKLKLALFISKNSYECNELLNTFGINSFNLTKKKFPGGHETVQKVLDFISDEFANNTNGNNNLYKISCAFAQYAFKNSDGILYPSLQRKYQGINFALKPEIIDNKFSLELVIKDKFVKINERELLNTESKESIIIKDGKIIWGETKFHFNEKPSF